MKMTTYVRHIPTDRQYEVFIELKLDRMGESGPIKRAIKRAIKGNGTATALSGGAIIEVRRVEQEAAK